MRRLPRPLRRHLDRQRGLAGRLDEHARSGPSAAGSPSRRPGPSSTSAALDDPDALVRLDNLDKRIAFRSLQRKLDPDGPLFIDFEDHVRAYAGTDRRPV